jgi:hypothetical protein
MNNVPDFDDEYFRAIEEDVMRVLERKGFFGALDDLFDPLEASTPAVVCHRDYRNAREVLLARGFPESDFADIFGVLKERGACCDCEILYNAAESSRLKGKYWMARARGEQPDKPNHRGDSE